MVCVVFSNSLSSSSGCEDCITVRTNETSWLSLSLSHPRRLERNIPPPPYLRRLNSNDNAPLPHLDPLHSHNLTSNHSEGIDIGYTVSEIDAVKQLRSVLPCAVVNNGGYGVEACGVGQVGC